MAQEYLKGMLSGGEVVLVDTRQHWMAAVRFALKPILIFVLAGLLILVNAWLPNDGIWDLITSLIHIVLVIGLIVAIVWLPIDIVRWYSRKYVLTNRRSIRMDGVFRKRTFESSLEQINDINMVQSVLGRAMDYADLTIYTASDTANETYEQLRDGVQFKKAVLDAKEAIRAGQPLTELREGFVVHGGTNLASMRADGKLEEAAAQAGASESATQTASEPEAAPQPDSPAADVAAPPASSEASPDATVEEASVAGSTPSSSPSEPDESKTA